MNRTDRLLGILLELQARGELPARDLAARFEVALRTIYRDVQALCETGVPVIATPGKGYRLMEGYFLPPLAFTPDEAAMLVLGGEFVQQRLDAEPRRAAAAALHKLNALLPEAQRLAVERWRQEVRLPGQRVAANDGDLRRLRRAIRQHRVVRLLYRSFPRPRPEQREIEPIRLALIGDTWQVSAYCRLRQAPRVFRLSRIEQLELLAETFEPGARHAFNPARPQPDAALSEARVRFDRGCERWVREQQPFLLLREEEDAEGAIFVFALRNEPELLGWLLGWGAAFEVLSPTAFRRRVQQELRQMIARHEGAEVVDGPSRGAAAADSTVSAARL